MKVMKKLLINSVMMLLVLSLLTGLVYPLAVTGLAQILFPRQANGSMIVEGGKTVGSTLIGQPFNDPKYFWSRPSATTVTGGTDPLPYNAESSNASNLGPTNPDLTKAVAERIQKLRNADPGNTAPIPVDLVTASASGYLLRIGRLPNRILSVNVACDSWSTREAGPIGISKNHSGLLVAVADACFGTVPRLDR
jgi:K+-transporting ATPase KdpC subunit